MRQDLERLIERVDNIDSDNIYSCISQIKEQIIELAKIVDNVHSRAMPQDPR